jgi:flagellum-specific peptidoglycan hydrolase FlgJ
MRTILLILFTFCAFYAFAQRDVGVYLQQFDSLAVDMMLKHGIPASLVLGIAIHESAAGTSKLCAEKCNHFGLKGKKPSNKTKSGYAYRYIDFVSDEASFAHFANLVTSKKFYAALKGEADPLKWLKALKRTGYAPSSKWVSRTNFIIKKYNLTEYDRMMRDSTENRQ